MILYYTGRIFQLIGLIAMPSSIWVAQFEHNERGSIGIFVASILVFSAGTVLLKFSGRGKG
jgi:hypothetical protein